MGNSFKSILGNGRTLEDANMKISCSCEFSCGSEIWFLDNREDVVSTESARRYLRATRRTSEMITSGLKMIRRSRDAYLDTCSLLHAY